MVVEEVGHEGEVELVHALRHVGRGDEAAAAELVRLLQHDLRPGQQVGLQQRVPVDPRVRGGDLVEEVGVGLAVLDVAGEVGDPVRRPGPLQLVVDPAEQDGLRAHLHQTLELLPALKQVRQARALLQADLVKQPDPDTFTSQINCREHTDNC